MGCAASSDRAERRGPARGHSEESTTGLLLVGQDQEPVADAAAWRRRGCKVALEPMKRAESAPELATPGSPSFRYYCQKAAAFDALVAEDGDGDGSVGITETSQAPKTNKIRVEDASTMSKIKIVEVSKPKQASKWLRFGGLAVVAAAWFNLFSRHRSKPSTPTSLAAANSLPPRPAAAARSHT